MLIEGPTTSIASGLDLIRKKEGPEATAFGLTIPLMLKSDGTKFGKSRVAQSG